MITIDASIKARFNTAFAAPNVVDSVTGGSTGLGIGTNEKITASYRPKVTFVFCTRSLQKKVHKLCND